MHARTHMHAHTRTHTCIHAHAHTCVHAHKHTHSYTHACTHTHTHTHQHAARMYTHACTLYYKKYTVKSDDVYNNVPSPPRQMIKSIFCNTVDIVTTGMQILNNDGITAKYINRTYTLSVTTLPFC